MLSSLVQSQSQKCAETADMFLNSQRTDAMWFRAPSFTDLDVPMATVARSTPVPGGESLGSAPSVDVHVAV